MPIVNTKNVRSQTISTDGFSNLIRDLERLYLDRQHSDITINVKNKELVAHKTILVARSKVFAAMFRHDMAEKNSGIVYIDDCDPESFEDFIFYLYTGKFDKVSSSNVFSLYEIADKYDVEELKQTCAVSMARELCQNSFCDVVRLAVLHDDSYLLGAVSNFFLKNPQMIFHTIKSQDFLGKNPSIINELLNAAGKFMKE